MAISAGVGAAATADDLASAPTATTSRHVQLVTYVRELPQDTGDESESFDESEASDESSASDQSEASDESEASGGSATSGWEPLAGSGEPDWAQESRIRQLNNPHQRAHEMSKLHMKQDVERQRQQREELMDRLSN